MAEDIYIQYASTLPVKAKVSPLFASVLASIMIATPPQGNITPKNIRTSLQDIRQELSDMDLALETRLRFQNLPVLQAERRRELNRAGVLYEATNAGFRYLIDMSFLSATWPNSVFPAFGLLTPDGSTCSITAHKKEDDWRESKIHTVFEPNIPEELKKFYSPTVKKLESFFEEGRRERKIGRYGISAVYAGMMPYKLEEYVVSCMNNPFFDSVWIVFEAPFWEINEVVQVRRDPLVVGRHVSKEFPAAGPTYFLLGAFDPTPWEAAAAISFTSRI